MPQTTQPDLTFLEPTQTWKGVKLFCTTRHGGVGQPPYDTFNLGLGAQDDPATVLENRQRLRQRLPGEPAWLAQVHGARVVDADEPVLFAPGQQPPSADACVTAQPKRVLAVLTADCLSVVLADQAGSVLGVAHAGWKGLAAGVLEATLLKMQAKVPRASDWQAWVGPFRWAKRFGRRLRGRAPNSLGFFYPTRWWLVSGAPIWQASRAGVYKKWVSPRLKTVVYAR